MMNDRRSTDWTTRPKSLNLRPQIHRITARFSDGTVLTKRARLDNSRFGWRVSWIDVAGHPGAVMGFAHTEHSAVKCITKERRLLWSGCTDIKEEIVGTQSGDDIKPAQDGKDRYLKVLYPPVDAGPTWAEACRKNTRYLVLAETSNHYIVKVLGEEYRINKKTMTICGPWKGSPVFLKMFPTDPVKG
jgi:hypothetical protein